MSATELRARGEGATTREPTAWTQPLRRATAAFLVVFAAWQLVTNAVLVREADLERTLRATNPTLTADDVHGPAMQYYTISVVVVAVIAGALLLLALGSLRGWRWAFWLDLAVLALMSVTILTNALALANPGVQALPSAAIAVNLLVAVVALGLLIWFIAAAVRYGPWATRRPGT
ncbi:MAG TPA: hypothetical protein VOB72_22875 [Candidatus Dormibacteraeota bacterium]|nr:hypothetical protein [Candidatus Dormibacteraeota bacterium]